MLQPEHSAGAAGRDQHMSCSALPVRAGLLMVRAALRDIISTGEAQCAKH